MCATSVQMEEIYKNQVPIRASLTVSENVREQLEVISNNGREPPPFTNAVLNGGGAPDRPTYKLADPL